MRISTSEKDNIIKALEEVLKKESIPLKGISLFLFGSRAHDDLKGGDIDLLLKVPPDILRQVKNLKIKFSVKIQDLIGEQKIDIAIYDCTTGDDPFLNIISKTAVLLKHW